MDCRTFNIRRGTSTAQLDDWLSADEDAALMCETCRCSMHRENQQFGQHWLIHTCELKPRQ